MVYRYLFVLLAAVLAAGCRSGFAPGFPERLEAAVAAMPLPAAGEHPRVLFTPAELPEIRARAATPGGRKAVQAVAWKADHPGKQVLENARAGKPETAQNLVLHAFHQAFLYVITEDATRRDNAVALLGAWAVQHGAKHTFGDAWRNGYHFALAYDWLYHDLPTATRDAMRETMAAGMTDKTLRDWEQLGYIRGAIITGRPCDWGAIAGGSMLMQWMAIAGDDPRATRDFLAAIVYQLQYIADLGITADGYMNAGNGYAGGDFVNYGYAVRALEVHGVPLVDHPHLRAFAEWLAYESIPGQYVFDTCSFSNGSHQGLSPLVVTLARRHGGVAAWLADQARGPAHDDEIGVPGILWGTFADAPLPPPDLPLAHYISTMGVSFSRSGWEAGSFFRLHMEPLVPGKTHPDKGTFTFYSHGQNFAADSENGFPKSEDHNIVLIDGVGQYSSGGASVLDAIPRGYLANGLVDISHLETTPAYERRLEYTRTRPGPVEFGKLEYGRGLPFRWEVYRPMTHAHRYGLYVRGPLNPYVIILDDIQQDDTERRYEWLMHSRTAGEVAGPGHARFLSRYGGEYVQAETTAAVTFSAELAENGPYTVYVLVRKWPQLKNWFSHQVTVAVNNRSMYFRPGDYLSDWQWVNAGTCDLRAGKNGVSIRAGRGLRVAQVVAVPGDGAPPARMVDGLPEGDVPAGLVVFTRQPELNPAEWTVRRENRARMGLHFMHPGAERLALDFWRKPRAVPLALRARQQAVRAGFAAVLIPGDDRDPAPVWTSTGAGTATLSWGPFVDHLFADPARTGTAAAGSVRTDGRFALVRTRGESVVGYILVAGTTLSYRGQVLVRRAGAPVTLASDGTGDMVATFQAPAFPWRVRQSADGRRVDVNGTGPLPLKIHAPRAVDCTVNGRQVWFSRDGFGNIYPKIELTELTHGSEPPNSTPADAVPAADTSAPALAAEIPLPRDDWRFRTDPDDVGRDRRWFAADFADAAWQKIGIGDHWDAFGVKHKGFAWYRKTFTLPAKPAGGGKVKLAFGAVDEMAWVWVNGEWVGEYTEFGPAGWTEPFSLDVTKQIRWGAANQITVRIENTAGGGGIYKPVTLHVVNAP